MKIITRHLLSEFLQHLFYCLAAFCMIFLLYDLFDHIGAFISSDVSWRKILYYYGSLLVTSLEFLAPASLLLATLYTLWQLTRNSEITAMRASGISLYRIMQPFVVVGLIFTAITGGVKEFITPKAGFWAITFAQNDFQEVDRPIFNNHAYYSVPKRRLWLLSEFNLNNPSVLEGVKVTQERSDGTRIKDIFATKVEYLDGRWWFYGLQTQEYNAQDNPSGGLTPAVPDPDSVQEMPDLTEAPEDFTRSLKPWEFLSSMEMFRYLRTHPDLSEKSAAQKHFDIHARIATPWACVVMIVFGIPSGVRGGRRNALIGIFSAISLFFAFYAVTQIGIFLGKRDILWPWLGAWLSNGVFLTAGSIMIWRMR